MSLSHPPPQKSSPLTPPTPPGLSGVDFLRAYFAPRQRLRLKEAAGCIGLSFSQFFRREREGTLGLRIRKDEIGERYVLLNDLVSYLFPDEDSGHALMPTKMRPGRPRKGTKGGAR